MSPAFSAANSTPSHKFHKGPQSKHLQDASTCTAGLNTLLSPTTNPTQTTKQASLPALHIKSPSAQHNSQESPDSTVGGSHLQKDANSLRFAFSNQNGIPLSLVALADFQASIQELQVDWIGIAETHMDSSKAHVCELFRLALQSSSGYNYVYCVFSTSNIDHGSDYKRGGVLQLAVNNLATRTISKHSDALKKFTCQTHTGRNGKKLTTITGYRVCEGSKGPASTLAQQRAMLVTAQRLANPRKVFLSDLTEHIQQRQIQGKSIILCLDANESMIKLNSGICKLMETCGLIDLHAHLYPDISLPSHRSGSAKIDFMLISPDLLESISQAGIHAFDDILQSDHRTLFLDLNMTKLFHGLSSDPVSLQNRSFTTKNQKRTSVFCQEVSSEWSRRQITRRIQVLSAISKLPNEMQRKDQLNNMWKKLDNKIGHVIRQAEKRLHVPSHKHHAWSPAMSQAGKKKRYWRNRLALAIAASPARSQMPIHRPLEIFDDYTTEISIIQSRYDDATKEYTSIIKRDLVYRTDHLNTLITNLSTWRDPDAKRELRSLKALQVAEQQTKLFRKLRATLRSRMSGAISHVHVPPALATAIKDLPLTTRSTPLQPPSTSIQEILKQTIRTKRGPTEE